MSWTSQTRYKLCVVYDPAAGICFRQNPFLGKSDMNYLSSHGLLTFVRAGPVFPKYASSIKGSDFNMVEMGARRTRLAEFPGRV